MKQRGKGVLAKIEDVAMMQPQIDKLIVEVTKKIGSEPSKVFRTAVAAATDDDSPQDYAFAAVIAQLLAEPLPARDRVDRIATLVKLARPAT
jgi:hypothetical protein